VADLVTHITDLTARPTRHLTLATTTTKDFKTFTLSFLLSAYRITGNSTDMSISKRTDYLKYFMYTFASFKGGINFRFVPGFFTSMSNRGIYHTIYEATVASATETTAKVTFATPLVPVMATIPYYSTYLFHPSAPQPNNPYSYTGMNGFYYYAHATQSFDKTGDSPIEIEIFTSSANDFQFGYQIGPPSSKVSLAL